MNYRLYEYDLIAADDQNYAVNNVFRTSKIVNIEENDTDDQIMEKLKDIGIKTSKIEIDNNSFSDNVIYFNYSDKAGDYEGSPACELRKEQKEGFYAVI